MLNKLSLDNKFDNQI